MSTETNKAIVRRWQNEVLGGRKFDLIDQVLHPNYVLHDNNINGRDAARVAFSEMMTNPAYDFQNMDTVAEGDKVVSRWISSDGDKRYKGISIFRIADGKIIEDWYCSEEIKPD